MSTSPMRVSIEYRTGGYRPGSPRQRLAASVLAAAIIAAVLLIAIYQTQVAPLQKSRNPVTFDVSDKNTTKGAKVQQKQKEAERETRRVVREQREDIARVVPPVEQPPAEKPAFTFLKLSHADFAASDIGAMKKAPGNAAPSGRGNSLAYGPGEGPGGAILHKADWFREPTDAQLGGYLPATRPPSGWGEIACQTLEHYRVDNCQIMGESPRGSGFGRAVLNAAWQFQVIPPRINGQPQVGTWVSIRIDYTEKGAVEG